MADEIGSANGGVEAGFDPLEGDIGPLLFGQRDLGFLDLHRQRMAALLADCAHQPVEQRWLAGFLPDLTDVGDYPWLVHPVDARPCREVVEVAGGNIEPSA